MPARRDRTRHSPIQMQCSPTLCGSFKFLRSNQITTQICVGASAFSLWPGGKLKGREPLVGGAAKKRAGLRRGQRPTIAGDQRSQKHGKQVGGLGDQGVQGHNELPKLT